ncbi:PREDICTED: alanyl-tRNA editing protein Aarsd1-like [Acropora digitifera]|uniref:alanyl-tRNA editing protein Aarsd1-like n=1 Tax=Acropora digitifera TaxID=70779 RepID=UPI00077A4261|nr:PREDICTED: alanyl-tRNA editing protein Aarsd1-like [Acropora digitifera]
MFLAHRLTVSSIIVRISFLIRCNPFTTRAPIQRNTKMVFACQQDSFLKHLKTKVLSCKGSKLAGKEAFEVILEDTVLFPEGGGQPDDHGTVNGVEVMRVIRRGATAVHFLPQAIPERTEVELVVDWPRRFDHMQQHSGQHLISAIIENNFGYETTSWELGKLRSHIELSCKKLTAEEMDCIEKTANQIIRNSTPVNVHVHPSAACPDLKNASTRGLPDDHVGPVRVIEIPGIDRNMCCGTHVSNLSQVQVIKLFPDTESMRGGTRLFFLAGDRVLKYLGRALDNEKSLTKMLSVGPDEHPTAVDRIQTSLKSLNKNAKSQLKELAQLEAYQLKASSEEKKYFYIHRENGDMEYMNTLVNGLSDQHLPVLVTVGPDKGPGQFLLVGEEKQVSQIGPKIASVLEGKGGGKKGRYQGKANTLKARKEAEELLVQFTSVSINEG